METISTWIILQKLHKSVSISKNQIQLKLVNNNIYRNKL